MARKTGLLEVPDDKELFEIFGITVRVREVLHEWPLSRVDKLVTPEGVLILKIQLSASSVERRFYEQVRDPLLPVPVDTAELYGCDLLLLPCLKGDAEDWGKFTDEEIRERVCSLNQGFLRFRDAPVFFSYAVEKDLLRALEESASVLLTAGFDEEGLEIIRSWLGTADLYKSPVGIVHGDLKADNLLGGFVIDWQRPMRAPLPLEEELSLLLSGRAVHGDFGAMAAFVLMHWYAYANLHFLPYPFVAGMAKRYAELCLEIISSGGGEGDR